MKRVPLIIFAGLLVLAGCTRHRTSEKPPIHLNQNMDDQPRYKAQAYSPFFANHMAMRDPVAGTIARDQLHEDVEYYTGRDKDSNLVKKNPLPVTMKLLRRGEERYNIYCSPCHSRVGDGRGIVVIRGLVPPPSFHEDRLRQIEDGHIFEVITNGLRNMPPYKYQIPVADRWAIVAYFRALQKSHEVPAELVPESMRQ
jgi:hypothetical protein